MPTPSLKELTIEVVQQDAQPQTTPRLRTMTAEVVSQAPQPQFSPKLRTMTVEVVPFVPPPPFSPKLREVTVETVQQDAQPQFSPKLRTMTVEIVPGCIALAPPSPCGWGNHEWGPDPWGGCSVAIPRFTGQLMLAFQDPVVEGDVPVLACRRMERLDLCSLLPRFYCREDKDVQLGGTGDHHLILGTFYDWLYGANGETGVADDVASFLCINNPRETKDRFLDALLLHLGFNIQIPLTTERKRQVIPLLVNLYKQKGTNAGLEAALSLLLGIPVEIFPKAGEDFESLVAGEEAERTLTDITAASASVRVTKPFKFDVGTNLVIIDHTAPFQAWVDTPILDVVADRVFFDPASQTIVNTIEAGAKAFADRLCDQLEDPPNVGGCSPLGVDGFDPTDKALFTMYIDIQRTVLTTADLADGDTSVTLDDLGFIVVGSKVKFKDQVNPLNPDVVVTVKTVDTGTNTITFNPISLTETIEAGAITRNVFNQEQLSLIDRIVEFGKPNFVFHFLTRDEATELAEAE